MRILLIHSFYKPGMPSGENDVVLSQLDLLRRAGHDVELWSEASPDEMSLVDQVRIGLRVAAGRGHDPRPFIHEFKPDLIHIHNLFPNVSLKWLSDCDVPLVMSIHNYRTVCANGVFLRDSRPCTDCLAGSARSALAHGCYRGSRAATIPVVSFQRHLRAAIAADVDALIFTSGLSEEVLRPRLASQYSLVLPNFVSDVGLSLGDAPEPARDFYVFLGRLTPEKGVDRLLRIWPRSRRLVIMGDGPQRQELQRIAAGRAVDFMGFVGPDVRNELLRNARGLVLPSITLEADPVVVAQALSAGTPCIVNSQTSSARLADRSAALRVYHDEESLNVALDGLESTDAREAARALYLETWSAESWLRTYGEKILSRLAPDPPR